MTPRRIRLVLRPPVGAKHGLSRGAELAVTAVDVGGVWVETVTGKMVKLLKPEYDVIEWHTAADKMGTT